MEGKGEISTSRLADSEVICIAGTCNCWSLTCCWERRLSQAGSARSLSKFCRSFLWASTSIYSNISIARELFDDPLPTSVSCFEMLEPIIPALEHLSKSLYIMKVQIHTWFLPLWVSLRTFCKLIAVLPITAVQGHPDPASSIETIR